MGVCVLGDLIRIAVGFDFVVSANVLAWFELYAHRFMKFWGSWGMIISFEDDFGCFQFDNSLRKQFMLLILGIDSKKYSIYFCNKYSLHEIFIIYFTIIKIKKKFQNFSQNNFFSITIFQKNQSPGM